MKEKEYTAKTTGDVDVIVSASSNTNESVWFHMQDSAHKFKIGLGDIVSAINFAEDQGLVPELPDDWWLAMSVQYPEYFEYVEEEGKTRCVDSKQKLEEMSRHTN